MDNKTLSILIPAYNEAKTIHLILDKVLAVKLDSNFKKEILIINDYSRDNTEEVVNDYISAHSGIDIKQSEEIFLAIKQKAMNDWLNEIDLLRNGQIR